MVRHRFLVPACKGSNPFTPDYEHPIGSVKNELTTTGGGAKLRRQLRFLVASFWRLASQQVGDLVSKLPSASVKSLSIIGRNGGEGGPPY